MHFNCEVFRVKNLRCVCVSRSLTSPSSPVVSIQPRLHQRPTCQERKWNRPPSCGDEPRDLNNSDAPLLTKHSCSSAERSSLIISLRGGFYRGVTRGNMEPVERAPRLWRNHNSLDLRWPPWALTTGATLQNRRLLSTRRPLQNGFFISQTIRRRRRWMRSRLHKAEVPGVR